MMNNYKLHSRQGEGYQRDVDKKVHSADTKDSETNASGILSNAVYIWSLMFCEADAQTEDIGLQLQGAPFHAHV